MSSSILTLSLGTNLGDRRANINRALELLDRSMRSHYIQLSPVIETQACGFDGPDFLNCIVRYRTRRSALSVLDICKRIEKQMGRTDSPQYDDRGVRVYHDRIIDIDILTYGEMKISTDRLTIPHPQVESRPFIKELLLLL